MDSMYPLYFRAALKTADGRLLEYGRASLSPETGSIDFKGAFIPLLRLGTPVQILQLSGDEEIHAFTGEVYISSPDLLRIVSARDDELTPAEKRLPVDVRLPAEIRPVSERELRLIDPLSPRHVRWMRAQLLSLSPDAVRFSCPEAFPPDQRLLFQTDGPPRLRGVAVQIEQVISFGEGGCLCRILSVPDAYSAALASFVEQEHRRARVFSGDRPGGSGKQDKKP